MHPVITKPCAEIFLSDTISDLLDASNLQRILDNYFDITDKIYNADIYIGRLYETIDTNLLQIVLSSDSSLKEQQNAFPFQPFLNSKSDEHIIDEKLLCDFILTICNLYQIPKKADNTILLLC